MRIYLSIIILIILSCQSEKSKQEINVEELTISSIHEAFKSGQYTSADLVRAYLKQIEKYNPKVNAISVLNENAISDAERLDQEFKDTGKLRPLHGIPMLVKDNFNTIGMPTTAGARALQNFIPDQNATMVQQLLDAGAIIIAKTNMAEWAFSAKHTESTTIGTTRNPYNLDYVPAGSSGGTGAGMALNFATIGLGSDTGNSIRGPSSHNALVGFRTTIGLTSRYGIIPLYLRNDVGGPMCRTVEDATRVLQVISGYDAHDPVTRYSNGKVSDNYLENLKVDGLKGARIGVLRQLSDQDPDPEVAELFKQAIIDLKSAGAIIVDPLDVPNFHELKQNQWCAEFRTDLEAYLAEFVKNDTIKTLEDVIRIGTNSEFAKTRLDYFRTHSGRSSDPNEVCKNPYEDARRISFREAIENEMDAHKLDAIIYPTWNNRPAKIDRFEEEYKGDNNQVIAPHTGQPAFTVPMGYTTGNLPAGLQFLGRSFDEKTLIRLSYAYEQLTQHRKMPEIAL